MAASLLAVVNLYIILFNNSSTSTSEKKMPKRVGASTQPCFTPLLTGKRLRLSPRTGRFLACLHGKTLSSLGDWEGIRSSE